MVGFFSIKKSDYIFILTKLGLMFYYCNEPRKMLFSLLKQSNMLAACSAKINIKHSADETKQNTKHQKPNSKQIKAQTDRLKSGTNEEK
jgi:hypothetical protein